MALLRRFIEIRDGDLEAVDLQVPLRWLQTGDPDINPLSPPASNHFRLFGVGLGLPDLAAVVEAYSHDLTHSGARALHTLATAEHALDLFTRATGCQPLWGTPLSLRPQDEEVTGSWGNPAGYTGAAITFKHFPLPDGPFACASHDIIVHEVGHASLDHFRHWNANGDPETRAVSESIADILAMLSAGTSARVRACAIEQTGGQFETQPNVLSRFGEIPPAPGVPGGWLRDAVGAPPYSGAASGDEHEDAQALTGALYRGFAYHLAAFGGQNPQAGHVQASLYELAGAVFRAIASDDLISPAVTRSRLMATAIKYASDAFRALLREAARDQGFPVAHSAPLA